jgi:hypothetical protein
MFCGAQKLFLVEQFSEFSTMREKNFAVTFVGLDETGTARGDR